MEEAAQSNHSFHFIQPKKFNSIKFLFFHSFQQFFDWWIDERKYYNSINKVDEIKQRQEKSLILIGFVNESTLCPAHQQHFISFLFSLSNGRRDWNEVCWGLRAPSGLWLLKEMKAINRARRERANNESMEWGWMDWLFVGYWLGGAQGN